MGVTKKILRDGDGSNYPQKGDGLTMVSSYAIFDISIDLTRRKIPKNRWHDCATYVMSLLSLSLSLDSSSFPLYSTTLGLWHRTVVNSTRVAIRVALSNLTSAEERSSKDGTKVWYK